MVQLIRPIRDTPATPTDIQVGKGVPIEVIRFHVVCALQHCRRTPETEYTVRARGWGHPAPVIAPMFDHPPRNVGLPYEFMY